LFFGSESRTLLFLRWPVCLDDRVRALPDIPGPTENISRGEGRRT
jgi:hypothetical protein